MIAQLYYWKYSNKLFNQSFQFLSIFLLTTNPYINENYLCMSTDILSKASSSDLVDLVPSLKSVSNKLEIIQSKYDMNQDEALK